LVGTNTVVADNPMLNVRSWKGNNPIRIVLDRTLRIPKEAHVFDKTVKTIVITALEHSASSENLIFETVDFSKNLAEQVCEVLHKHQIQSVIIEGGLQTLHSYIEAGLWDEARIFVGENEFENGVEAPLISGRLVEELKIKKDRLKIMMND